MAGDNLPPVIFLAFANERADQIRYLRNLPEEARQLRKLLTQAKRKKLCTFILRENATLDDILDVFQNAQYERRIALFHFGGHANGYQLLVESAAGKPAPATARGLAAFFGQQSGLELVFLNGCSTQRQVDGLLEAGVSVVIATLCEIDDTVATNFAIRFYRGLGSGASIETAFKEAQAAIQTSTTQVRNLYAEEQITDDRVVDQWPWAIYTRKGAESALQWNLPDAASNPLFGLPEVEHTDLPEQPFRHLNWFGREHAAIFFGRGYQIRDLYQRITARAADEPIILLYGQSGVGKSSLLDAGLRPYLEQSHEIVFQRRDPVQGLSAALQMALGAPAEMVSADTWRTVEQQLGKPLVIILDQVEELFTRARPELGDELARFLTTLQAIFADRTQRPCGRLILSFRKEWLAEFTKQMEIYKLPCAKILLERLDRRGVVEAITCLARERRLQQHYGLEVDDEVAGIIADDLLIDPGSPVAPILQILLAEMWEAAKKANYDHPRFSLALYQQMKVDGLCLEDFLEKQFAKLQESHKDEVASGLALDILAFHTTRFGTAEQHGESKLQKTYAHCKTVLPVLLQRLKDLYILVDLTQNQPEAERMSRLAHDTLAPIVRARFEESDQPGQRALRILASRALDWAEQETEQSDAPNNALPPTKPAEIESLPWSAIQEEVVQAKTKARKRRKWLRWTMAQTFVLALRISRANQTRLAQSLRSRFTKLHKPKVWAFKMLGWLQKEQPTLDDQDLALVEHGETGMRARTTAEERLVLASKAARTRRRLTAATFVVLLLGALFFNGYLWQARQWAAFDQQRALIGRLADQAQQLLTVNPLLALQISQTALPNVEQPYVPKAEFVFHAAAHALLARQVLPVSASPVTVERFAWGETRLAVADANLIKLITYQLEPTRTVTLTGHLLPVRAIQWHEDRQTLLSYDQQSVRIWRDGQQRALYASNPQAPITCAQWRPAHGQVTLCQGNELQLWSPETNSITPLHTFTDTVNMAVWSAKGQRLAAWDNQNTLWIMQMVTETVAPLRLAVNAHPKRIRQSAWSPDEQQLVTVSGDGTLRHWSTTDETQDWQIVHSRALIGAQFISNTHFVTWGGIADTARLWSIHKQEPERWFGAESDAVQAIRSDEHGLLTFANNGDVQLWAVESGRRLALFRGHRNYVLDARWQGTKLATTSVDGTVHVWEVDQTQQSVTRELVIKAEPVVLHHAESISSNQRNDVLGVAWLDEQRLLTLSLDGKLRSWQVYDDWGQPLCRGVDGEGFPRCFNQSRILAMDDAPFVAAQWVNNDTIRAATKTTIVQVAGSGTSTTTMPITPVVGRNTQVVWRPDSLQVFTYVQALTTTENFTSFVYGVQDQAVRVQQLGSIESAFWLEAGLLISRPFTEVVLLDPNAGTVRTTVVRAGCRSEQRCTLTTAAAQQDGWLAFGDERGMVYVWHLAEEAATPFTLPLAGAKVCPTTDNAAAIDTETPIDELIWLSDGRHLLVAGRSVVLWDVTERKALWCYPSSGLKTHIALSPDERLVALTSDRAFHVLDADQGDLLWTNQEHDEVVLGVQWVRGRVWPHQQRATLPWLDWLAPWVGGEQDSYSDERLLLLTWSGDGTARLWEWHSRSEIFRAPSTDNEDQITAAGINGAGTQLFTASHQGLLRVWPLWLQTPEQAITAVDRQAFPAP